MFSKAIEKGIKYTKPLLTGRMYYEKRRIVNGISSLIVLNAEGDILTCGHVADLFMIADETNEVFYPILAELQGKSNKEQAKIEKKYDIKPDTLVALHNIIVDIADNPGRLNIIKHPILDLAIIKLENKENVLIKDFPIFRTENALVGEMMCNLGFAFPEYDTFYYDENKNLVCTSNKIMNFPVFPLNGMITRHIIDPNQEITMFEISCPCLPGQSGGPILDEKGYICGIQAGTKRISSNYNNDMPFDLDLGIGINVKAVTNFLDQHHIKYNKAPTK